MSNHTPGPWEIVVGDNYMVRSEHTPNKYPHRFPSDDLGPIIALVGNRSSDFGKSDARLIAAAPDLLEALDNLVSACELPGDNCHIEQALQAAITAILKATGGTK
jgi:hypothetical protein